MFAFPIAAMACYMAHLQNDAPSKSRMRNIVGKPTCEEFRDRALAVPLLGLKNRLSYSLVTTKKNFEETNIPNFFKINVMQPAYILNNPKTQSSHTMGVKLVQCEESDNLRRTFRERLVSCQEEADDMDDPLQVLGNADNSTGPSVEKPDRSKECPGMTS